MRNLYEIKERDLHKRSLTYGKLHLVASNNTISAETNAIQYIQYMTQISLILSRERVLLLKKQHQGATRDEALALDISDETAELNEAVLKHIELCCRTVNGAIPLLIGATIHARRDLNSHEALYFDENQYRSDTEASNEKALEKLMQITEQFRIASKAARLQ